MQLIQMSLRLLDCMCACMYECYSCFSVFSPIKDVLALSLILLVYVDDVMYALGISGSAVLALPLSWWCY